MRIAIDGRLLYYQRAGISTYIRGLLSGFAALSLDDEFVILQSRHDQNDAACGRRMRVVRFATPCHHRYEQWLLPLEMLRVTADALHSPDFIPPLRRRCASVITIHDLAFLRYPSLLTPESARYYGQVDEAVASAEAIIAVSQSTKQDLLQLLGAPEHKVHVVPEAANPAYRVLSDGRAVEAVAERYGLEPGFFLFVGTLEPRKNLTSLVKAYSLLQSRRQAKLPKLVLVGSRGWLYQDVFTLVDELGLGDEVRFLGPVAMDELVALYNAAVSLVFVSLYEGFGLPPLEAMACGTPVIASAVSSLPEVVGDAALLVDPRDVDAIAGAMERVAYDAPLRGKLREAGLQRAGLFSWERTARETISVYREAARR